jgi:hypothetical protein
MITRRLRNVNGCYFLDESNNLLTLRVPSDLYRHIEPNKEYFVLFDDSNVVVQLVAV